MAEQRLIDAIAYYKELKEEMDYPGRSEEFMIAIDVAIADLADAPTIDAAPVVHGRWVDRWGGKYANPHYECSECKKSALYKCDYDVLANGLWLQDLSDYCPHCGAKMDLEVPDGKT